MTAKIATTHNVNFTQQRVVTASRALDTVYQNTTGKAMLVVVSVLTAGTTDSGVYGVTDSSNAPSTRIAVAAASPETAGVKIAPPMSFIVLPGNFYAVVTVPGLTTPTLDFWTEYT